MTYDKIPSEGRVAPLVICNIGNTSKQKHLIQLIQRSENNNSAPVTFDY